MARFRGLFEVKDMKKYENYNKQYYISENPSETTIKVSRYVIEAWNYDGEFFKKNTEVDNSSVKIPELRLTIQEYMTYVDELVKYKEFLIEERPKLDIRKVA